MKQPILLIILIPLLLFSQLTDSQKEICQSVKTVKIVVKQNYGDAGFKNLPFENEAKQFLSKFTDITILSEDGISTDAILNITVNGKALSNEYSTSYLSSSGQVQYSGAQINGNISYKISSNIYYENSFVGYEYTPLEIDRSYNSPQDAPFNKAFENMTLQSELIKMVGAIYGVEPVIRALEESSQSVRLAAIETCVALDDPRCVEPLIARIKKEDLIDANIIRALGEIKDPRAVPAIISELNNSTWSSANALGKLNDPRAIKPLIDQLAIPHNSTLRKEVIKALKIITGKNFRKNHAKWLKWWEENKINY